MRKMAREARDKKAGRPIHRQKQAEVARLQDRLCSVSRRKDKEKQPSKAHRMNRLIAGARLSKVHSTYDKIRDGRTTPQSPESTPSAQDGSAKVRSSKRP
ncbi:hypothetical protein KIN20_038148 [Parelaphostrongylus tenuis]|uniref:Uncharacterized protein n=1 Tax=Parelaphostrongylus tenuis TaxID=148309 RepID=A0AAD5RF27_PARTN|nr:hypothetical protein KIN20_038148 [Parelaphostrongylus tenuis]